MLIYDCAQLQYTILHRTVLIILPPDKHHSSDVVYWRGGGSGWDEMVMTTIWWRCWWLRSTEYGWLNTAYSSVTEVNLVANDHERKVLGVAWASLDEKLVSPALKCLKRVGHSDVVHQDAAVGSPVERHTETLKPLLSSCVPDLKHFNMQQPPYDTPTYSFTINSTL